MRTPDINHRYCGWRESSKLVSPMKGALLDIEALARSISILEDVYTPPVTDTGRDSVAALIEEALEYRMLIQSARVLLAYLQRRLW